MASLKMLVLAAGTLFCCLLLATPSTAETDGTITTTLTVNVSTSLLLPSTNLTSVTSTSLESTNMSSPVYEGCFKDQSSNRRMIQLAKRDKNMTTLKCAALAAARGYAVFATQNRQNCYGSNNLRKAKSLGPSQACNKTCTGDKSLICGGSKANNLYSIPVIDMTPSPPQRASSSQGAGGFTGPLMPGRCLSSTSVSCLWSKNSMFSICIQPDRNIVVSLYGTKGQKNYIETNTAVPATSWSNAPWYLCMQSNGNLVAYDFNTFTIFWHSNTAVGPGSTNSLVMQDDGNVVMYNADGAVKWETNTAGILKLNTAPMFDACLRSDSATESCRWSDNYFYSVCMDSTRNVVLSKHPYGVNGKKVAYWSLPITTPIGTNIGPFQLCLRAMQPGQFIGSYVNSRNEFWSKNVGNGIFYLMSIQNNGNLVVYEQGSSLISWNSGTVLPISCPSVYGFTTAVLGDSYTGANIGQVTTGGLAAIEAACMADCRCTSFDSAGYLYQVTAPNIVNSRLCFYTRILDRCPGLVGYTAYFEQGHGGDDIRQIDASLRLSPLCVAMNGGGACKGVCECASFNSDGWIKNSKAGTMDAGKTYRNLCSYVREVAPRMQDIVRNGQPVRICLPAS